MSEIHNVISRITLLVHAYSTLLALREGSDRANVQLILAVHGGGVAPYNQRTVWAD